MAREWCQLGQGNDLQELMSLSCPSDWERTADRIWEGMSGVSSADTCLCNGEKGVPVTSSCSWGESKQSEVHEKGQRAGQTCPIWGVGGGMLRADREAPRAEASLTLLSVPLSPEPSYTPAI